MDRASVFQVSKAISQPERAYGVVQLTPRSRHAAAKAPSDAEIIAGVRAGRPDAANALYDRVQPVVDRTIRRVLTATGPDYDDLVQAAFERMIRSLCRKPLDSDSDLGAWSAAVAAHTALDWLRKRYRERRLLDATSDVLREPTATLGVERRLEARSDVLFIQRVLARMKDAPAEALLLHDVLGYELLEVAQMTGTSYPAAQSRLLRARKELVRLAHAVRPKDGKTS